jgi:murein DD-endopeptidase MepM/ murein hydrolase activator NlpD
VQGSAFQAHPLFVAVRGLSSGETVKLLWESKSYTLAWHEGSQEYRAVLPISIDVRGKHTLQMEGGPSRAVEVKPRDFGMQYLSISPDTLASYDKPQNKADDRAIQEVMQELDPVQRWEGAFRVPCEAPETTGFGQRRLYNGWKKGWHKGLDLGGWEGQSVLAPAHGRVVHLAEGIVNGNTVVLSHGLGVFSVYLHLLDWQVELGQEVRSGQQIGRVGGTGGFAPHLHWEVRCWGGPVHPKAFYQLPKSWT